MKDERQFIGIKDDYWGLLIQESLEGIYRCILPGAESFPEITLMELDQLLQTGSLAEISNDITKELLEKECLPRNNNQLASFYNYYLSLDELSQKIFLMTIDQDDVKPELKFKPELEQEADEALKDLLDF